MIVPVAYLCAGESDAGLSNDAMCLMFSCVENRLKDNTSVSDSGPISLWLISNVESDLCVCVDLIPGHR